jgi:hypothetical protein
MPTKRKAGDRFTIAFIDLKTNEVRQYQIGYWDMEWPYRSQAQKVVDKQQPGSKGLLKVVEGCCVPRGQYWDPITDTFYNKVDSQTEMAV